ncbi:hypothetical protein YC2023_048343 [Brassica napus]
MHSSNSCLDNKAAEAKPENTPLRKHGSRSYMIAYKMKQKRLGRPKYLGSRRPFSKDFSNLKVKLKRMFHQIWPKTGLARRYHYSNGLGNKEILKNEEGKEHKLQSHNILNRVVQVLHAQSYKSVFMLSSTEDNWRYYDALSFTQQPRQVLSSALTKATQWA